MPLKMILPKRTQFIRKHIYFLFLVLGAMFLCQSMVYGQKNPPISPPGKVTGIVIEGKSAPVIGATVRNTTTNAFTATNTKGEFEITGNEGNILTVSHIGFKTETIVLGNLNKLSITMQESRRELDEVVVVAYGEMKKEEITGSVASVNMDDLRKAPVPDFKQALAGRVAGVQVNSNDGQPGSGINVVIRGGNSLTQSNEPLYVVDGFPISGFASSSLNPEDIASITVLKDADATAVYGSRAANGVIVVETKSGKSGTPAISYHGYAGVQTLLKKIPVMDAYEYVAYSFERNSSRANSRYLEGRGLTLEDYRNMPSIDWQDIVFKPAYLQNHSLALRGGNTQTKYSLSGSIVDQDGIAPNSGFTRYQGRFSLDQEIGKRLKVHIDANYVRTRNYGLIASQQAQGGANAAFSYFLFQTWASRPVAEPGEDITGKLFTEGEEDPDGGGLINPLISAQNAIRQQTHTRLLTNAKIEYKILDYLVFTSRGGIYTTNNRTESFYNSKTAQGYPFLNNLRGVNGNFGDIQNVNWTTENILTFSKTVKRGHYVNFLAGVSAQGYDDNNYGYGVNKVEREEMGLSALQYGDPSDVTSSRTKNVLASYFVRGNYNIKRKYFLSASFRTDGSSRFSQQNRWGYFPSGGFSWLMGKEKFMKNIKFINDAKLRLSYGATGNNGVGNFSQYSTLSFGNSFYSFNNEIPVRAVRFGNLANPNLKWETTIQSNIGYDLALFNNRVNFVIDLYRKTTKDLLLNADLPGAIGFTSQYRNIGRVDNDGLELSLTTKNVQKKDFTWESTFNISFNRNRIRELTYGQEMFFSRVNWVNGYNETNLYVAQVGQSASNFYGYIWDGNYQYSDFDQNANGSWTLKSSVATNGGSRSSIMPGDIKYRDLNGDKIVNEQDMVIIGRALPIHVGGFNNNFHYKGFDLNVFFQWSYGNDIYNANRLVLEGNVWDGNQYASYVNRWTEENQNNTYFRNRGYGPLGMYSSRTIEDGSFLRLKTVHLSYAFPAPVLKMLKVKSLSTYLSGQDLITWTNYSGMDPEVFTRNTFLTQGFDWSAYPRARTFTFGVRVDF